MEVVDLEHDFVPPMALVIKDFERCHLISSIVAKYKSDVGFNEGMKALELLTLNIILDLFIWQFAYFLILMLIILCFPDP